MEKIRKYSNPTFTGIKSSEIVYAKGGKIKSEKGNSFNNTVTSIAPYVSNVANAFRKLPKPIASRAESTLNANLISLDAARTDVDNSQRNLNRETDYRVSNPAVAQAIKAATFGKTVQAKNELAQNEANQNAQIKNQTNQFNQGVINRNIQRENEFNDKVIGRSIQEQNLLSDNLSDVGTKFQQQRADNAAIELEREKNSYLPDFYEKNSSGTSVYDRLKARRSARGYALGGEIDPKKIPAKQPNDSLIPTTFKESGFKSDSIPLYEAGARPYKLVNGRLNNYNLNSENNFNEFANPSNTIIKDVASPEDINNILNKPFNRTATLNKKYKGDAGHVKDIIREYETNDGTKYGTDQIVLRKEPRLAIGKRKTVKGYNDFDANGQPRVAIRKMGGKLKRM